MDRRQRKTREAIFGAFTQLLAQKDFNRITVGEIIERADVGRATFYAHFETKDYLLKAFCEELFCHIFDMETENAHSHKHIFDCEGSPSAFVHLFQHLQRNDQNILLLLSSQNNDLFLSYFKSNLEVLVQRHLSLFEDRKPQNLPDGFWENHIASVYVATLKWWIEHGMKERPETIAEYFFAVV